MTASIGAEIAKLLWQANSIRVTRGQPFVLAAGWASPVYVDCRLLIGEAAWRRRTVELAAAYVRSNFPSDAFDAIAGAETAGMPFAAWLADSLDLKLRYVRKRALGVGHDGQVEGGAVTGLRTLLVDDLTTDGGSKLGFARGLRAAGAKVDHILTIFYQDAFPGARERLGAAGLSLHALATWADVLPADHDGRLSQEDASEIKAFLADPVTWSRSKGGRG